MKQLEDSKTWELDSGNWKLDSNQYILSSFLTDQGELKNKKLNLFKQLYGNLIDNVSGKTFPPEFAYNPETGEAIKRSKPFDHNHAWIAPYGQTVTDNEVNNKDHGLKYSNNLKILANNMQKMDEIAQVEIPLKFSGNIEFFSICAGTDIPQLIAINKKNGNIFIFIEQENSWEELEAPSNGRLASFSKELQDCWGVASYFDKNNNKHILLLPTDYGLAELSIQAQELKYTITYHGNGQCLGKPVFWNKFFIVPIFSDNKIKFWNHKIKKYIEYSDVILKDMFYNVVHDTEKVIWVGVKGQLSLNLKSDKSIEATYQEWSPNHEPCFDFGSPFMDKEGDFYQFFLNKNKDEQYYFYQCLNLKSNIDKKSSPRFSTGSTGYYFDQKICSRQNKYNIWDHEKKTEHEILLVPLMEDLNQDKDLVLGIAFRDIGSKSIDEILTDKKEQRISLFMDTPNDGLHHFYSGTLTNPVNKSRFVIHHNHLYFYHPDLPKLQGWEL